MNNIDWTYHLEQGNFQGIYLMLQSLDTEEITLNCSPKHLKSVLEDLRSVALVLCLKLQEKDSHEQC